MAKSGYLYSYRPPNPQLAIVVFMMAFIPDDSILDYRHGAAIWGTKSYSCIDAVQHRAARF